MSSEYSNWLSQLLPDPREVCGIKLNPLSIGHLIWLDRLDVFPPTEREEVLTCSLICSREVEDIEETLADPWLSLKIELWLFKYKGFKEIVWLDEAVKFCDYYEEGTQSPPVMKEEKAESINDSATPFLQHLKTTLQSALGYSSSAALNAPYNRAIWDYYVHHENEGALRVIDRVKRKEMKETADRNRDDVLKQAQEILLKEARDAV